MVGRSTGHKPLTLIYFRSGLGQNKKLKVQGASGVMLPISFVDLSADPEQIPWWGRLVIVTITCSFLILTQSRS